MYKFKNLEANKHYEDLPSVAMNFDGTFIENIIPEYKTLTVSGRELMGYDVTTFGGIPGRDGSWIKEKTLPPRHLVVTYQIETESDESYRLAYNRLNAFLRTAGDVPIYFNDEPGWEYLGQISTVSEVDTSTNSALGSFVITCQDPFKFSNPFTLTGEEIETGLDALYPYDLLIFEATLPVSASKVVIKNETTGRHIIANGSFSAGQVLAIKDKTLELNGQNIMNRLDYKESDWHQFEIGPGDRITMTPKAPISLVLRERLL